MGMGDKEEGEDATQLRVVPSQCAVEPGHVGVASDTTEASFRLQYSGGAPAPDHLPLLQRFTRPERWRTFPIRFSIRFVG